MARRATVPETVIFVAPVYATDGIQVHRFAAILFHNSSEGAHAMGPLELCL